MLEIVYPFLVVHLWLDFLEWLDAKLGTPFIGMVDEVREQHKHGPAQPGHRRRKDRSSID